MTVLIFTAHGTPIPQGSNRAYNGRIVSSNAARLKPWRSILTHAALEEKLRTSTPTYIHPVLIRAAFYFKRPQNHYRTGKHSHLLRDSAIAYPIGRGSGDLDKHQRALGDALVDAGVLHDDSLIAKWITEKRWADPGELLEHPGAVVHIDHLQPGLPPRISLTPTKTPQEHE